MTSPAECLRNDGSTAASARTLTGSNPPFIGSSDTSAEPGTYNMLVTATDAGGASVKWRDTAVVSGTALSASPAYPSLTESNGGAPVTPSPTPMATSLPEITEPPLPGAMARAR